MANDEPAPLGTDQPEDLAARTPVRRGTNAVAWGAIAVSMLGVTHAPLLPPAWLACFGVFLGLGVGHLGRSRVRPVIVWPVGVVAGLAFGAVACFVTLVRGMTIWAVLDVALMAVGVLVGRAFGATWRGIALASLSAALGLSGLDVYGRLTQCPLELQYQEDGAH